MSDAKHKLFRKFPRIIRHFLINYYVSKQTNRFNKLMKKAGSRWMEKIPNYNNAFSLDTEENITKQISHFWKTIKADGDDNSAKAYANSKINWDILLVKKNVDKLLKENDTILDFGCNAGRALHVFVESGYNGIGVEINPEAVDYGKKSFPSLKRAKFYVGDGAAVLQEIGTDSVDLVYTFAVLRHVSPENINIVAKELARISRNCIITFEDEASTSYRTYPRNYRKIFETFGYKQIVKEYAIDHRCPIDIGGLGTILRIFKKS